MLLSADEIRSRITEYRAHGGSLRALGRLLSVMDPHRATRPMKWERFMSGQRKANVRTLATLSRLMVALDKYGTAENATLAALEQEPHLGGAFVRLKNNHTARVCSGCKEPRGLHEFPSYKPTADGLDSMCDTCHRARWRANRQRKKVALLQAVPA